MVAVSVAELTDLKTRDFHIERVLKDFEIDEDVYFDLASEYIGRVLEYDWWKNYCAKRGISQYRTDGLGNNISSFDPTKLVLDNPDLINIHCFYTLYLIYRGLSTQLSSPYETAQRNSKYWLDEFNTHWTRLTSVSDFYDLDQDGVKELSEINQNHSDSQRFGNRYVR